MDETRLPVSELALFQRINRRLLRDRHQLSVVHGAWTSALDRRFYLRDAANPHAPEALVDLETLGRELGVLLPSERVTETVNPRILMATLPDTTP